MGRILIIMAFISLQAEAQKKPLDHSVYNDWQSNGERIISNDGKWVVYTITPQEGDALLFIHSTDGSDFKKNIPRGYNALITEDNQFVVFKIKPLFKETREARIKKKKPEDFPKDSFAIIELGKDSVWKTARIKSYKTPKKAGGWVAYHKEKDSATNKQQGLPTQKTVDSLTKTIDSLILLVREIKNIKAGNADEADANEDPAGAETNTEGSDLVLRNLRNSKDKLFSNVAEYYFNAYGQKLLMKITKSAKDSLSKNSVVIYDLGKDKLDTILKGGNDFKGFAFSEDGSKAAFVAERDAREKALQKWYKLYVYYSDRDSAQILIDTTSAGILSGHTVSENGNVSFSKSGKRLFFGTSPVQQPKDTTLIESDLVKLDIWHYKDDYLQSQQLFNQQNELKRSYLAVYDLAQQKMEQLGSKDLPTILQTNEGDGVSFYAVTDTGRRVQRQWGETKFDVYAVNVATAAKTLIKKNHEGQFYPSSTGRYLLLYDANAKHYFNWDGSRLKNVTSKIKFPLYNEEHDSPGNPTSYGIMGWHEGDSAVYIYDRYDIWKIDPRGLIEPLNITLNGRKTINQYRYVRLDSNENFFKHAQSLYFRIQNQKSKKEGVAFARLFNQLNFYRIEKNSPHHFTLSAKAKYSDALIVTKENYTSSPDLYYYSGPSSVNTESDPALIRLSSLNTQQAQYNWGTAELFSWKAFNGKQLDGVLYKPEDFDSSKAYPMIIYFYERLSDGLYNYHAPSPTPSRLNIPFYVSRGYLVFAPDITYTIGHPAKDAYNSVVSGAQALAKKRWVDAKNIGIQGQSWGGIQVAQLITMTNMFKAAWAGAPVANMTSAYGGIRWESGVNRQFQYEKTQSRIGATLWQRPDLYIENSPLFHVPKMKTPLVIMANDADGAVPWYQGIELFTAMRRLDKKVWMLNYNGEAHNLVERKNRKDIQIRQQQYFDWLLKGAPPARWITEGVPAIQKGKDWGLESVEEE